MFESKYYSLFIIIFVAFIMTIKNIRNEQLFRPNLPAGEYKLKIIAAFNCNTSKNYLIDINLHVSKVSNTKVILTGNINYTVPFDDSLNSNINMAVFNKIGGWTNNAFVYTTKKACSTTKFMLRDGWKLTLDSMNISNYNCPIKPGKYEMTRLDPHELFQKILRAKDFFYGTYKVQYFITNNKNIEIGCLIVILDILRLWEN
ncbi:uncharacterized protein LOC126902213 [Daktulosphaira vitifoliae]|uniref:uncharacterized protein LOC126902213 n=1 Tax=Daktulosphaira vitifoliae TaxID=58002 RepID=UPI0021A993D9|nr:uncharacterized protein LOC126902213 [Daktulosphaira vitifoliae]